MRYFQRLWLFEADGRGGGGDASRDNNGDDNQQGDPVSFATFQEWYDNLPDDQKKLTAPAQQHFQRVYDTLKTVRQERDDFSDQLRKATKKLKEGSEERVEFERLSTELDAAQKRADFYEEAPRHNCLNAKAAYAIAVSADLFDKKGNVDWSALREEAPELFAETNRRNLPKKRSAGNGTGGAAPQAVSMNEWIRSQAGRNTAQ